jgi:hypothetical protein
MARPSRPDHPRVLTCDAPAGDAITSRGLQSRLLPGRTPPIMTDPIIPGDLLTRTKVITGLRQVADYLEQHPGLPVCTLGWELSDYPATGASEAERRAEVDKMAAILGVPVTDETAEGGHYIAARSFGLISYRSICIPDRRAAHDALMSYSGCIAPASPGTTGVA